MSRCVRQAAIAGAAILTAIVWCGSQAPAAVDFSVGIRYVSDTGSVSECSAKANQALAAFLQDPSESSPGSGDWSAHSQNGVNGTPTASAVVRCYGLSHGYVVTFTCAAQTPPAPENASVICSQLAENFGGQH